MMIRPSVPIPGPLSVARFIERSNRFLLQVRLEDTGESVEAHMADPGRLKELLLPEKKLWLRPARNPSRRTRWTAVLVESPDGDELVSLDSTLPNRLIRRALETGRIEEFGDWQLVKSEVTLGRSRFDFLLNGQDETQLVLEVKSVTLVQEGVGLFPDAVTERGARHVRELAELAAKPGWNAAVLFVLQRSGANGIRAAREIDPRFAEALTGAAKAGVRVLGRRCRVFTDRVELGRSVPAVAD
jgi:sugar fermentation stimulation protein A